MRRASEVFPFLVFFFYFSYYLRIFCCHEDKEELNLNSGVAAPSSVSKKHSRCASGPAIRRLAFRVCQKKEMRKEKSDREIKEEREKGKEA